MPLEYENRTTVLGRFGDVCQGPNLDWRHKCKDEIIANTLMVFTDELWQDLPYQAIVDSATSVNFREPFGFEGGDQTQCSPSTGNAETTLCDFVLPNLQFLSIGVPAKHYKEWRDRFCQKFPVHRGFKPFEVVGGRVVFKKTDNTEASMTFAGEVSGELSKVIWDHLLRTYWVGNASLVDQFDGFFTLFDDGISSQGTCEDYPLVPTCIDLALYILGAAAAAAGGTVGPGDIVLPVGHPDRPGDAPADNVIDIYAGTLFATSLDISNMDVVDILTAWYELVTNEWGIDVIEWMLGVGKNQTKCLASVAACKQACTGGDCRQLLTSDNRDQARADREAKYIKERSIRLYPYEETLIPMRQSHALRQRNKIIFMPWIFSTSDGPTRTLLWVWRDQQAANAGLMRDVPGLLDNIDYRPLGDSDLHPRDVDVPRAFERRAFSWLHDNDDSCYKWWNDAEAALIPQCPHLWLCLDGVDCSNVITLPCRNPGIETAIVSCANVVPNSEYTLTFSNVGGSLNNIAVGDPVTISSASGLTAVAGSVTTFTSIVAGVVTVNVTLDELGPFADCVWDGDNLDAGGQILVRSA